MIVSGPDIAQAQLIAKQLSTGAARLATLNGKQVLISTTPTAINQQQQQQTPQQTQQQPPTVIKAENPTVIPNNVKLPSEPLPPTAIKKEEVKKVVAPETQQQQSTSGSTTHVTAQLVQTAQGPRIVLQGIQGANLNKEQLLNIQQQVNIKKKISYQFSADFLTKLL